jgi:hypothetical protein
MMRAVKMEKTKIGKTSDVPAGVKNNRCGTASCVVPRPLGPNVLGALHGTVAATALMAYDARPAVAGPDACTDAEPTMVINLMALT